MIKYFLSTLMVAGMATTLSAEGLETFRSIVSKNSDFGGKSSVGIQKLADARSQALRDLLGPTEKPGEKLAAKRYPDLKLYDDQGVALAYPGERVRANRKVNSSYFRSVLGNAAQALKEKETLGKPRAFDPSKQLYELEQDRWESRRQIFKDYILETKQNGRSVFDILIEHVYSEIEVAKAMALSTTTPATAPSDDNLGNTAYEIQLRSALRRSLNETRPQILKTLGDLIRVEVYEGTAMRLVFENTIGGNKSQFSIHLSVLANIRSGDDQYFIMMLGFLRDQLNTLIANAYERDPNSGEPILEGADKKLKDTSDANRKLIRMYSDVSEAIDRRFTQAVVVNRSILALKVEDINFLTDRLIQLRGTDLPAEGEISALKEIVAPEMIKLADDNAKRLEDSKKTGSSTQPVLSTRIEKLALDVETVDRDLVFYDDLDHQLYRLQFELEYENGRGAR